MTAIVFAGPTLPPAARASDPSLTWLPPVRQGELYRAALAGPRIIGIVDGYFEVTPTVWHKEILWAMARGIHVLGSGSIGALRAAELRSFGMRGIGRVYEAFRDGRLEDDDEVAILHGPAELGYPPVTEAMVNIRETCEAAAAAGVIGAAVARSLIDAAKGLFYKDRTFDAVLQLARRSGAPARALDAFAKWLPRGRIDRKRLDAEAMVEAIRSELAAGLPALCVGYTLADTAAWRAARARADREA